MRVDVQRLELKHVLRFGTTNVAQTTLRRVHLVQTKCTRVELRLVLELASQTSPGLHQMQRMISSPRSVSHGTAVHSSRNPSDEVIEKLDGRRVFEGRPSGVTPYAARGHPARRGGDEGRP